jgi:hypothetical protein
VIYKEKLRGHIFSVILGAQDRFRRHLSHCQDGSAVCAITTGKLYRALADETTSSALGTPLEWPEAKKNAHHVRAWGIEQLLTIWNKAKGKERDALLWGDEVEYLVVSYVEDDPNVKLSLRQADILHALAQDEELSKEGGCVPDLQEVSGSK